MAKDKPIEASEKLQKVLKKRYDKDQEDLIQEDKDKEKVKQGKAWTKTGIFIRYTDAAKHRDLIKESSPEYDTKIKRCGVKQSKFKVLKRKNKELVKKTKE